MIVVFDIEANKLINPDKIWCIVCKDIATGEYHIFKELDKADEVKRFLEFSSKVTTWIGHNILGYDIIHINGIVGGNIPVDKCLDTLIVSKMADYSRPKHSVEDYGLEFGIEKGKFNDWSKYSDAMVTYCIRDVDITHLIYNKYIKFINRDAHRLAIELEHKFQFVVNDLSKNGFSFNVKKANELLKKVTEELKVLDVAILESFKPKYNHVRTIIPKATKYGTISLSNIPKELRKDIHTFTIGIPYEYGKYIPFNPSSHKQIIDVLWEAKWRPEDRTKTYIDTERELRQLKYLKRKSTEVDLKIKICEDKIIKLEKYGWKINENNLGTLGKDAPASASTLAKRILLESRRRTLTEWLGLVAEDDRIHGKFYGIGAWTHRMAHQQPNTANIPNEFDTAGNKKLLGKEFRQLWQAPRNRLLVGVDAEGMQLRIFAHYIDDAEFTDALVRGKKEDKSDPHSLNQRILGPVCRSRSAAKRFIFALLLGGGIGKLTEILGCQQVQAEDALERLMLRYTGFDLLKREVIPKDARRGWFTGLDGRSVAIPSDTVGGRKHLAMSGYLQNGEAVIMKSATLKWWSKLEDYNAKLVNFVHDEWQIECPNDMKIALEIAEMVSKSLDQTGIDLKLKCPMAGSYWNDDHKDYTIGTNWYQTH